jgi:hypothetical protein
LALGYADDLTIFVESDTELQKALCIIENFKNGSGLAVNREKSEILELGIKSTTIGILVKRTIKITGMHFCLNQADMSQKNWDGVCVCVCVIVYFQDRWYSYRYLSGF